MGMKIPLPTCPPQSAIWTATHNFFEWNPRSKPSFHPRTMQITTTMKQFGFLASRRQLKSVNIGRHRIDRAIADGDLLAVRMGWVATANASQASIIAVLHGARLTGATALGSYGIWCGDDHRIHLQVPEDSHRVTQAPLTPIARFTPPRFFVPKLVTHWAPFEIGEVEAPAWRVSISDAIGRFATTEPVEQVAAALESAVTTNRVTRRAVAHIIQRLPKRLHRLSNDLTFLAGSGLETISKMRFDALGFRVRQQVQIGIDRVDLVIDGWLVIELDGDQWHEAAIDRMRTNRIIRSGYGVLRFGYADIFERWEETMATVLRMLDDGHRR